MPIANFVVLGVAVGAPLPAPTPPQPRPPSPHPRGPKRTGRKRAVKNLGSWVEAAQAVRRDDDAPREGRADASVALLKELSGASAPRSGRCSPPRKQEQPPPVQQYMKKMKRKRAAGPGSRRGSRSWSHRRPATDPIDPASPPRALKHAVRGRAPAPQLPADILFLAARLADHTLTPAMHRAAASFCGSRRRPAAAGCFPHRFGGLAAAVWKTRWLEARANAMVVLP